MTEQAITQEQLHLPLLQFIADHGGEIDRQEDDLLDALADRLGLTEEERQRTTEGRDRPQWQSTVEYTRLKLIENYEAIERPSSSEEHGIWRLTDAGWELLANPPAELVRQFEEWKAGRQETRPDDAEEPPTKPSGEFQVRLEQMQESLERITDQTIRTKRNSALARVLKEEYEFFCQLCDPEVPECPRIPMANGRFYVEVHHILGLAEVAGRFEHGQMDDSEYINLTSYHNVLVLCPYHHRLVHHHDPPFEFDWDNLQFAAGGEFVLPVINRHAPHLEVD